MAELRTAAGAVIAVLAALTLTGCSTTEPGQATTSTSDPQTSSGGSSSVSLPSRPENLSLVGVDPCSLLTAAQAQQFGLEAGQHIGTQTMFNVPMCGFRFANGAAGEEYASYAVTSTGIQYWLNPALIDTVTQVSVGGFPAVTILGKESLATGCDVAVSTANNEMFVVGLSATPAGETNAQACQQTQQVAAAAVATLQSVK